MRKIAILALVAVASQSFAADLFWSGDTTGGPVFNRPVSLTSLSGVGTAVHYQTQEFHVTATGNYAFEVNGVSHPDTYILWYANSFDPNNPLTNLMNGDDDYSGAFTMLSGSGAGFSSSRIANGDTSNYTSAPAGSLLTAGTTYVAVVTAFDNNSFGTYDAAIGGGPGDAVAGAVPEPASMAVLGLGAAALLRRRKK